MKHRYKPKGSLIAALDVGSSKIACLIARITDDDGSLDIIGVGHHSAKGIKGSVIANIDQAEQVIRQCVHAAENMAADVMKGYPLREVIVNVSGSHIASHMQRADVQIAGHEVTENDIRRALVEAQEEVLSDEYELIHTIPIDYEIDGHKGIRDPQNMHGEYMGVDIHLVAADIGALRNLAMCIERSHLEISAFCSSAYAAGLACLVEDEMDLGCTVIDMGGAVTSFAVFHGGSLIYNDAVPIGGRHVTSDIAQGLTTSLNDAERLKILYGSALASNMDENELIDVPKVGEEDRNEPNHVPRSLLIGIIQPRLEEVFELVRARLQDSGLNQTIGRRVVLTGGACQLPGMRDLAQYVLDKQVRIGKPIRLTGLPDAISGPAFSCTAGLLTYFTERGGEMPADILAQVQPEGFWQQTKAWFKENW